MGSHMMMNILVVLWIATGIVVTIFPIAYLLSNWRHTPEGRALMLRSLAVAALVDETIFFYFVDASFVVRFWVQAATLIFTIYAAAYFAMVLIRGQIRASHLRRL